MSEQARDTRVSQGPAIPALAQGTVQELTTETAAAYAFVEFGTSPTAGTAESRIRVAAGVPEYFKVTGGEKVAAKVGTTSEVSAVTDVGTTVVRVLYDEVAGIVEVMEAG